MLKGEEVFVGREREIGQFFEFLKRKNWSAFVVIGEPGMGKSSFMKEVARRLMGDERFVVGFYEVPFSADIANPFVGVLEALVDDLAARTKEQVRSGLKRFAEAGKKVATKKVDRIARAFLKDLVTKLVGKYVEEELEEFKKELDETRTVYSLASEFVREHRSEFIYDFKEFFGELVKEFPEKEFVLLIDQFERAPMPSCDVLLDFVSGRHENVHMAVALKVEKKGSERFNYVRPHLEQLSAKIVRLPPLLVEEIEEWMEHLEKYFSYVELKRIWELSAGFPFTISEWLKTSKECDLREFEAVKGRYCVFVKWRIDGLRDECKLMLHRLSVLLQPLSVEDYAQLAEIEVGRYSLFLNELMDKQIFDRYADTFWFRHELIHYCIEKYLTDSEKEKYHENAARFFSRKLDEATVEKPVDFDVILLVYHRLFARRKGDKLEEAKTLHFLAMAEFDRGNFGRAEERYRQFQETLKKVGDQVGIAKLLHQLAKDEQAMYRYYEAEKLYCQCLEIRQKLRDQSGISETLDQLARLHMDLADPYSGSLGGKFDPKYYEALKLYKQSLDIKRRIGDQRGIALSYGRLGLLYEALDKPTIAANYYFKALNIFQKIGDKPNAAKAKTYCETVITLYGIKRKR